VGNGRRIAGQSGSVGMRGAAVTLDREEKASTAAADELAGLAAAAIESNPFFSPPLLRPALRLLATEDVKSIIVRDNGGEPIAFAPLRPLRGYSRLPVRYAATWMHDHCFFAAPLIRRGCEREAFAGLFAEADRVGAFLRLASLDAEGELCAAAIRAAQDDGRETAISGLYQRAMLRGGFDPEATLSAALPGKKRKELRRQKNRLTDTGAVAFETLASDGPLDQWTDAFLALEASGWKGRSGTALASHPAHKDFLREALRGAHEAGTLQFCRLSCGEQPVAMIINFVERGAAYSFKIAFDESFARFSPGVLLEIELLFELAKRTDISFIDSCAQADHPMIDSIWRERRSIAALNIGKRNAASNALFKVLMGLERAAEMRRSRNNPKPEVAS
jgi:CelD/BcsL family acetyltransferase involved in cellulose biosynthesis